MAATHDPLFRAVDVTVHFKTGGYLSAGGSQEVHAVDNVSLEIEQGETLGLVGESGCGKTTLGRAMLQLERPTSGHVYLRDTDLTTLRGKALRRMRRHMQLIYQDPYSSLNPRLTIKDIVSEPMEIHHVFSGSGKDRRTRELLDAVGLSPAFLKRYPHECSGGQRQRVGIARALAASPMFIVCDEPVSSLDVSVQAQVVNLLRDLQREFRLTYMFIGHNLSVVRHISDKVAVMYLGKVVELADANELYSRPLHPYTMALISAVPIPNPVVERARRRVILSGDIPSASQPPSGCRFNSRCPYAQDVCRSDQPPTVSAGAGHWVACHFWKEIEAQRVSRTTP